MENNLLIGEILRTDDPLKIGRVKISIFGYYDNLDEEVIPWAFPINNVGSGNLIIPKVGEVVNCFFENGDYNIPFYYSNIKINENLKNITNSDYPKVWSLVHDDRLGEDGIGNKGTNRNLEIYYTETQGLIIKKGETFLNLRNSDESLLLKNGKTQKSIHISEKGISLGSEEVSKEPAVLGDTLEKLLNDFISDLGNISGIATPLGPTGPLSSSPQWIALVNKFKREFNKFKSKLITLD